MSAGYASRLSNYNNKGLVGLPESVDSKRVQKMKMERLTKWIKDSKHLVILTGAGISTSAGIPDFRGPKGIWTLEKKKKDASRKRSQDESSNYDSSTSSETLLEFGKAQPTVTHRAITYLAHVAGKLKYCVTQNVDGLHRRSGLSRDYHASIHGCVFTEVCSKCSREYFRDYDVGGMSFQPTGRHCTECQNETPLIDTLLDWEDSLPETDYGRAEEEFSKADLVLCLGTSLRIEPAASLPTRADRFVVVNLQATPYDEHAAMILKAPVDHVMDGVMGNMYGQDWKKTPLPAIEREWSRSESKRQQQQQQGDDSNRVQSTPEKPPKRNKKDTSPSCKESSASATSVVLDVEVIDLTVP